MRGHAGYRRSRVRRGFRGARPVPLPVAGAAHPLLDPICQITSFYRFVEALSTELGEDPDRPEHLRKVTETL